MIFSINLIIIVDTTISGVLKFVVKYINVIRNLNIKFLFYDLYCIIMVVKVMDNPIEFKSAKELYDRVLPALYSKVKEVRNLGFKYITETVNGNQTIYSFFVSEELLSYVNKNFDKRDFFLSNKMTF